MCYNIRMKNIFSGDWTIPVIVTISLVAFATTFAFELGSFRATVLDWAQRDLDARTVLAADHLDEPLRTGNFKALQAFARTCQAESARLTVFSAPGGLYFDSEPPRAKDQPRLYATAPAGEYTIRLGLPLSRVLVPFHRARLGFLFAALASASGVLLVFYLSYRQRVRVRELARLERFRREFVADVSHELKTPLTGILGAVDLLPTATPEGSIRLHELLRRESVRLNHLVQNILALARLERPDIAPRLTRLNLSEILTETARRFSDRAKAQGVALSVQTSDACFGRGDAEYLQDALGNLIDNALRYAQSDAIYLISQSAGNTVKIIVEDHGVGIPREEHTRIFERFHRLDPARANETGGSGLGLAIVRRLIRLQEGTIQLEDAHPHGARFVITLHAE